MAGSGLDLRIKQDKLVRDKVVDALRQAILDGVLGPGRRLTEKELTELTGVSRTSVREALRGLQAEGLVEESPSRGLRVAVPTAEEIEQIYEVRAELEPLAVRLFVERASQREVDELASAVDDLNPQGDINNEVLDRLNQVLLLGCRNPILEEVLGRLYSRIHALRRISASTPGRMAVAKQESPISCRRSNAVPPPMLRTRTVGTSPLPERPRRSRWDCSRRIRAPNRRRPERPRPRTEPCPKKDK